jgi:Protein of unknown function (DUF2911)
MWSAVACYRLGLAKLASPHAGVLQFAVAAASCRNPRRKQACALQNMTGRMIWNPGGIKMKRAFVIVSICFITAGLMAHEHIRDSASLDLGKGKVKIEYGTPKLKGRNIDEMIKPGVIWRLGMDDPTTLETSVALDFAGKKLAPGKYTLLARPDEKKNWTLLVSTGKEDPASVVVATPLHFMKENKPVDTLKITLEKSGNEASLLIAWGTYRLHGSFKAA